MLNKIFKNVKKVVQDGVVNTVKNIRNPKTKRINESTKNAVIRVNGKIVGDNVEVEQEKEIIVDDVEEQQSIIKKAASAVINTATTAINAVFVAQEVFGNECQKHYKTFFSSYFYTILGLWLFCGLTVISWPTFIVSSIVLVVSGIAAKSLVNLIVKPLISKAFN